MTRNTNNQTYLFELNVNVNFDEPQSNRDIALKQSLIHSKRKCFEKKEAFARRIYDWHILYLRDNCVISSLYSNENIMVVVLPSFVLFYNISYYHFLFAKIWFCHIICCQCSCQTILFN
jgi:hypothetical protein